MQVQCCLISQTAAFQLLVNAHNLLHGVNVHASVFWIHALHSGFLTHDNTVALGDANNMDEVAEDVVQH